MASLVTTHEEPAARAADVQGAPSPRAVAGGPAPSEETAPLGSAHRASTAPRPLGNTCRLEADARLGNATRLSTLGIA